MAAPVCGDASTPATLECIVPLFNNIVHAALIFIGSTVVILLIFSGYKFISSGGDAKQVEAARKSVTFAVVGLLVVLFSFFIINFIGSITGVTCIENFGLVGTCQ